jgi:tetratricopeptide (TPR) repeat protein
MVWPVCMAVGLLVSQAEASPSFDQLVEQGLQAYGAGRFQEAAQRFLDAYELSAEPELVFNAARSFEKALETEAAIEHYERFVSLQGTTAELRSRALQSLRSLRDELAAREAASGPDPERSPPPSSVRTAPPPPKKLRRVPEILLLSIGGASLVAGGVFGGLALAAQSDFEDAAPDDPGRVDQRDQAQDRALVADVLFGVGGVAVASGLLLWVLRKGPDPQAAGATSFGFDGRRLSLSTRF